MKKNKYKVTRKDIENSPINYSFTEVAVNNVANRKGAYNINKLAQEYKQLEEQHELLIDAFQKERENLCKQVKQESDARERFVKEVKRLKEQLAEKDKELEELKFEKRNLGGLIEKVSSKGQQEIRKQVCDMARKKIVEATCYDTEEEVRSVIYDLNASTALEIIDEIEQAEENKK